MEAVKLQLMDMGFNEAKIKRAIESCPEAQSLEQVMEWLIAHEDELNSDQPSSSGETPASVSKSKSIRQESIDNDKSQGAGPSNETASSMASKKKITVEEAQKLITERQAKRAEEERRKAVEDEKRRRVDGQKIAETRAELQDQERIRLAQQIRREKLEKELHRKQVLDKIARDREAMKAANKSGVGQQSSGPTQSTPSTSSASNKTPTKSAECKLALRFPDGSNIVRKFHSSEQLSAVKVFVQMEKAPANATGIEFIAPPNRKLTESLMNDTLEKLGLCPASRLEVKYNLAAWTDLD